MSPVAHEAYVVPIVLVLQLARDGVVLPLGDRDRLMAVHVRCGDAFHIRHLQWTQRGGSHATVFATHPQSEVAGHGSAWGRASGTPPFVTPSPKSPTVGDGGQEEGGRVGSLGEVGALELC